MEDNHLQKIIYQYHTNNIHKKLSQNLFIPFTWSITFTKASANTIWSQVTSASWYSSCKYCNFVTSNSANLSKCLCNDCNRASSSGLMAAENQKKKCFIFIYMGNGIYFTCTNQRMDQKNWNNYFQHFKLISTLTIKDLKQYELNQNLQLTFILHWRKLI